MLVRPRLIVAAIAAVLVAASCGGDDGGASSDGGLVVASLAEVPSAVLDDTDELVQIHLADLDAASEVADLDRPTLDDGEDAFGDWFGALSGLRDAPVFVPRLELHEGELFGESGAVVDELGWSILEVERFVEVSSPPVRFTVVRGEGVAPAEGLVEVADGVLAIGEGEDLEIGVEARTAARPLGRPLRLRADADAVAVSLTTDPVTAWRGDQPTLADSALFADAARALDEVEVVAAALVQGAARPVASSAIGIADPDELRELLGASAIGARFPVVGLGWYAVDGAAMVRVVYVFTDEGTAEAQAPIIEALFADGTSIVNGVPMSDLVELRSVDAEGSLVVVDVGLPDGRPPSTVLSMLQQGEIVFLVG
ncbi:MAG: hypothetical protein AAFZ07_12055 [Actinomycetota bacterium]